MVEKDAKKEVERMGILELADKQSEVLIKGLLQGVVPDTYDFEFSIKN